MNTVPLPQRAKSLMAAPKTDWEASVSPAAPPGEIEHHLIIIKELIDNIAGAKESLETAIDPILCPPVPFDGAVKPEANCKMSEELAFIVSRLTEIHHSLKLLRERVRL